MQPQDEFCQQVRDALHHLYDYPYLETHPLAQHYWPEGATGQSSRAQRLSRLLLESIEDLNPPGTAAPDSSQARYYAILVYHYVEERPTNDILHELGFSRSQFFREQQKALTMLATMVWDKLAQLPQIPPPTRNLLGSEVERVLSQQESLEPAEVLRGVLQAARHLAQQYNVTLVCDLEHGLPILYGSRTLLRQVLLKGLSDLIAHPGVREVRISMHAETRRLIIEMLTRMDRIGPVCSAPDLEAMQHLLKVVGGQWLNTHIEPGMGHYRLDFPVEPQKTLLVIEDNVGFIRVFEGYLNGHGYTVLGAGDGDRALDLARTLRPTAITLDIMMPNQDGWEILQALKTDPLTQDIPVIICSILEDPKLAYSLGAAAYLQKPISQNDILNTLRALEKM